MKTFKKISYTIIVSQLILILYCLISALVLCREVKMTPCFYLYTDYIYVKNELLSDLEDIDYYKEKDELKQIIEDEVGINIYIKFNANFKTDTLGLAVVQFRTIAIKNGLNSYDYAITLTHELLHLKRFSIQENYICLETFKTLYESENDTLHNYGIYFGITQIEGLYNTEYDCSDQIIEYIKGR